MTTTANKGLLGIFFLGTMSMIASAENNYPDDNAIRDTKDDEGRFLFGSGFPLTDDIAITLGNESLILIPLALLGLVLISTVVASLIAGIAGDTGPALGYDTGYSGYDVVRSGFNAGYQGLEASSYAIARSLQHAANKYL